MGLKVGVVGATGAVGRLVCENLPASGLEVDEVRLLASSRSEGETIVIGEEPIKVAVLTPQSLMGLDLVIASTPDDVAIDIAKWAEEAGAVMIDESAAHRMLEHVPLVIPEVNRHHALNHRGLIASPNCSTTQLAMCLKPLHDLAGLRRVIVTTFQAASGAGAAGSIELRNATEQALHQQALHQQPYAYSTFTQPLAFNVLPRIGRSYEDGTTSEEIKMVQETRKILEVADLAISATCVRVPVLIGHSESVWVECDRPIAAGDARRVFEAFPNTEVIDNLAEDAYPTPLACAGRDGVFVGRIRQDPSLANAVSFWCVSDNLRKGAAINALQIAQLLVSDRLIRPTETRQASGS